VLFEKMLVSSSLTFLLPAGNMVQTRWKTRVVSLSDKDPNDKLPIIPRHIS